MAAQNLYVQLNSKKREGQGIDLEVERIHLAANIDQALAKENMGHWAGSKVKSGDTLVIYFVANEKNQAIEIVEQCLRAYRNISFFDKPIIKQMQKGRPAR